MSLRLLKITKETRGEIAQLKEVSFAYIDGCFLGMSKISDLPVKLTIVNGRVEAEVENFHASAYSRRALRAEVKNLLNTAGPAAFDALSQYSDLKDSSCLLWDDTRPRQLNSKIAPVIENGPPLTGQILSGDQDEDKDT
jgi:hypothetical protein